MTIGERVKAKRQEIGMSVDDLAEKLNKNRATIYRYESNDIEKLPTTVLEPLANALGTTPAFLMGWEEDNPQPHIKGAIPYDCQELVCIPIVGRVAAGVCCLAEDYVEGYETASSDSIKIGYEYMYLRVQGDSMEPVIMENDLVLVQVQDVVSTGSYAVVIVDQEDGLVKKVKLEPSCITLVSENPYYPPRKFEKEEMNRIRIVGKVVECKRKF